MDTKGGHKSGHKKWTQKVDTKSGHQKWTQKVDTKVDTTSVPNTNKWSKLSEGEDHTNRVFR